jgi:GT2 family glycosyltransferase
MEKIGLVSVLYNSDNLLEDFFRSIAIQDYKDYAIYLVDNAPGEETRKIIKRLTEELHLTNVKHVESEGNVGTAEANNAGIELALAEGCDNIILLNNDIVFSDTHFFSSLISLSEQNDYKIIAPKIYYYQTNKLWYAGGEFEKWKAGAKHTGDRLEDNDAFNRSSFVTYAPTTFIFIKAEVLRKTGLLDKYYFIYVEDLDLIYRAMKNGYRIWYEAGLSLQHKVSSTTGGILSATGFYYNTRNRVYFARKFFKPLHVAVATFYVFASLFYHSLKQKNSKAVRSFFKGFFDGFKAKPPGAATIS